MPDMSHHIPLTVTIEPPTPPVTINANSRTGSANHAYRPPSPALSSGENTNRSSVESATSSHPIMHHNVDGASSELPAQYHEPAKELNQLDIDLEAGNYTSKNCPTVLVNGIPEKIPSEVVEQPLDLTYRFPRNDGGRLVKRSTDETDAAWPTKEEQKKMAREEKRARQRKNWNCLSSLSKKQRMWVQILIGLFIIGAAIGIGIGISKAVGGRVYNTDGGTSPIGADS